MHAKASGNHMLTKKSSGRRRRVEGMEVVGPEAQNIKRLLAGGKGR
jgi:ribosomal protein L35